MANNDGAGRGREATSNTAGSAYSCNFAGCKRSYHRKEHLTRHQLSHSGARLHICHICQRSFTRNDLLRRHASLHARDSGFANRVLIACDRCHARKTKCNGLIPCDICIKSQVQCKLERNAQRIASLDSSETSSENQSINIPIPSHSENPNSEVPQSHSKYVLKQNMATTVSTVHAIGSQMQQPIRNSVIDCSLLNMDILANSLPSVDSVGSWPFEEAWKVQQLLSNSQSDRTTINSSSSVFSKADISGIRSTTSTLDGESTIQGNSASANPMPGMQLSTLFSEGFKNPAFVDKCHLKDMPFLGKSLTAIDNYITNFFTELHPLWPIIHKPRFRRESQPCVLVCSMITLGAWLNGSHQSKMLSKALHAWTMNILHSEIEESILSRAFAMQGMLINVLRNIGIFEKDRIFVQYGNVEDAILSWVWKEEAKALAVVTFKADCYICILRNRPPSIRYDELNISLPFSYSLWNAPSVGAYYRRKDREPQERLEMSISDLFRDPLVYDKWEQRLSDLVEEDYFLAICAIQPALWEEKLQRSHDPDLNLAASSIRENLCYKLERWKSYVEVDRIDQLESPNLDRQKRTQANTLIFIHLSMLKLYTPMNSLEVLASWKRGNANLSVTMQHEHASRIKDWVSSKSARQAVWHAAYIYRLTVEQAGASWASPVIDPITNIALQKGALVTWGYAQAIRACELCVVPSDLSLSSTPPENRLLDLAKRANDDQYTKAIDFPDIGTHFYIVKPTEFAIDWIQMASLFPSLTKTKHSDSYASIDPSRPELSAKGKAVVVTGGGSGIGPAIVFAFARAGASDIAVFGRTERTLLATKKAVEGKYPHIHVFAAIADIVDENAVNKAFSDFKAVAGHIDILVSAAGYQPDLLPVKDIPVDEYFRGFEINVKGSLILAQAFCRTAASDAILINISSLATVMSPMPMMSGYNNSKMGALRMFDSFQLENPNFRVHHIHPGVIRTDMAKKTEAAGIIMPYDNVELPASFAVWIASPEAAFLKGKFVASYWDVGEMKARAKEIEDSDMLTLVLKGWSFNSR
ncbi:MAG: hypothetical protein M1834_001194 [Cirrosporium novae-zelandiae]|nr:MAG: hypothetical protein M1834_001194 [Cirrosporium novae-zelandiae]